MMAWQPGSLESTRALLRRDDEGHQGPKPARLRALNIQLPLEEHRLHGGCYQGLLWLSWGGPQGASVVTGAPPTWSREGAGRMCVCLAGVGGEMGGKDRAVHCLQGASRSLSRMERISSGTTSFCALRKPLASAFGYKPSKLLPKLFSGAAWPQEPHRFWSGVDSGLAEPELWLRFLSPLPQARVDDFVRELRSP